MVIALDTRLVMVIWMFFYYSLIVQLIAWNIMNLPPLYNHYSWLNHCFDGQMTIFDDWITMFAGTIPLLDG